MTAPERIVPIDRAPDEGESFEPRQPVDVRSAALTLLAVLAIVVALHLAAAMIIPVVLAVLISYALEPVVTALGRARVPRGAAAALLLLGIVCAGGALAYGLSGEVTAIVHQLPVTARRVRESLESGRPKGTAAIQQVRKAANELEKAANAAATPPPTPPGVTRVQVESPPFNVSDYVVWGSIGIAAALGQLVLILFLVFFLLASGDLYRRKLVKIAGPSLTEKKITVQILDDIDHQIEAFLFVQLLASALVAVATWLAFRGIGLQQAAVWGLLTGIFSSIPYFGPVLVTGGMAGVGYLQYGDGHLAITVSLVALAITSAKGLLLRRWLSRHTTSMNAVAVFVGLLFWGWIWSIWGLLLAVPMLMVLKSVCDHVDDLTPIAELLGG